jgi:hypothetical protein
MKSMNPVILNSVLVENLSQNKRVEEINFLNNSGGDEIEYPLTYQLPLLKYLAVFFRPSCKLRDRLKNMPCLILSTYLANSSSLIITPKVATYRLNKSQT